MTVQSARAKGDQEGGPEGAARVPLFFTLSLPLSLSLFLWPSVQNKSIRASMYVGRERARERKREAREREREKCVPRCTWYLQMHAHAQFAAFGL